MHATASSAVTAAPSAVGCAPSAAAIAPSAAAAPIITAAHTPAPSTAAPPTILSAGDIAVPPPPHPATTTEPPGTFSEDARLSKTEASQNLKGSQSYYYWHSDAERRRLAGEKPVPVGMPPKIDSHVEAEKEKPIRAISTFSFLDDGNVVKVYVQLEGDLSGVTLEQVDVQFTDNSLLLAIERPNAIHRLVVDRLMYPVDASRCKTSINKAGSLLLRLHKRDYMQRWSKLRGN